MLHRARRMDFPALVKPRSGFRVDPNLREYEAVRASFSWREAAKALDGLPAGGLNIAHEAVDRHAAGARCDHPALVFLGKHGEKRTIAYGELSGLSSRFANVLQGLGVAKGDRVFALLGRVPGLYVAALGTLKNRSVFCPLFSAFGPEPMQARLSLGDARVLVTTPALYAKKAAQIRDSLPKLEFVLLVGATGPPPPRTLDLDTLLATASDHFEIGRCSSGSAMRCFPLPHRRSAAAHLPAVSAEAENSPAPVQMRVCSRAAARPLARSSVRPTPQ